MLSFLPGSYIFIDVARAWQTGAKIPRRVIIAGGVLVLLGGAVALATYAGLLPVEGLTVGAVIAFVGFTLFAAISTLEQIRDALQQREQIEEVRVRAEENPAETKAAWDLARVKLEGYLDRNLRQVSMIYFLVIAVMIGGFILIGVGVAHALRSGGDLQPAALAALSGILVQFIGATFLVVYKSTMEQARHYVAVLERINAVGMSIQVLETIEEGPVELRNQARAELARDLLRMYGVAAS